MKIVAVQLDMAWEDRAHNHQRVQELLDATDIQAGSLIILPEMFETGFSMNVESVVPSQEREGEQLLQALARKHDCAVLGGVLAPLENGKSKNEAVAFAPDGTELVRYQKMQPFSYSGEHEHYPPGTSHALFEWQGIKIAPFVCYDLRFPELFRPAVAEGAELIAVIACWPKTRSEHWVRLLQARAIENLAISVGVNRCGREPGLEFDGRSTAFDHLGKQLFEASADEQVTTIEIDVATLREWRNTFPALDDMRLPGPVNAI